MQKEFLGAPEGPFLDLSGVLWGRFRPLGGTGASQGGSGSSMGRTWVFHRGILFKSDKMRLFSSRILTMPFFIYREFSSENRLGRAKCELQAFRFWPPLRIPLRKRLKVENHRGGVFRGDLRSHWEGIRGGLPPLHLR